MKRFLTIAALLWTVLAAGQIQSRSGETARNVRYSYTEAAELTLAGKIFPDTPNPYHRVDTARFKGWTEWQNFQVRSASGIMVAFRTNSTAIQLRPEYGELYYGVTTNVLAHRGFDLYIKAVEQKGRFAPSPDGHWVYAASAAPANGKEDKSFNLIKNMEAGMKECLLYLPLYSELRGLEIGVEEGAVIEAIPVPFRHRVAIYGSSYTHGVSCSRAGMTYPAQFARHTGIQLLSLGMSGQCKMQPYSLQALEAVDAEAFIFDTFSNPSIAEIRERLFPFIERLQAAHPGVPLIFQRTIYREGRNFDKGAERAEQGRIDVADSLMAIACKRYKDVYYIHPNATEKDHETSVDGIHPSDHGYGVWAQSIERQVLRILRRYGIR